MKKMLIFMIVILFALLIATNINEIKQITGYTVSEPEAKSFSTCTKAVCEENDDGIYCEDKLFVTCNNIEQQVEFPNGNATFPEDWEDPRNV